MKKLVMAMLAAASVLALTGCRTHRHHHPHHGRGPAMQNHGPQVAVPPPQHGRRMAVPPPPPPMRGRR